MAENENQVTPQAGAQQGDVPKTYTQDEVNAIVAQRLYRERSHTGGLTDDEIAEYRQMKAAQAAQAAGAHDSSIAALTTERDQARSDLNAANEKIQQMTRERYLSGKGVSDDDIEYYDFKIKKRVTKDKTYEQAADEFIQERAGSATRVDLGADLSGSGTRRTNPNAMMNDIIRRSKK